MIDHLKDFHDQLEASSKQFSKILEKYENVIPKRFNDKELFLSIYAIVCSRCFGEGLHSTSLIPMADQLNH